MKTTCFIICLFFFQCISFGQDTIKKSTEKKYQISFKAGGYYENFWGNKYIQPTPYSPNDVLQAHMYDGFTKIPTYGYQGGFLIIHKIIKKHWYLSTGLMFCNRKNILECKLDTNINPCGIIKFNYTYSNIELPVMLSYKANKINFFIGFHLPVFSFYKANYTYLSTQYWGTSQKTIDGSVVPLFAIPSQITSSSNPKITYDMPLILATFQISYNLKITNISFSPFLGIDTGTKKSFYLQCGIILPLQQFILNKTIKS